MIEIITFLVQKMLNKKELYIKQDRIIQELQELNYEREDIEQALELIFAGSNILENDNEFSYNYNRVFTRQEKLYLPVKLQGLIQRLIILNVLTPRESETLIAKTIQNVYGGSAQTSDIWDILQEIVDDEAKLEVISQEIPEFKDFFRREFKYIN